MAKKQQPKLSYGPNMGLIAGEAQVAASEAGLANTSGALTQGAGAMFAAIQKDEEEWDAKMDAYNESFPSSGQVNFIKDETNKQAVRSFLNNQKDEYVRLAETYEKTKDRGVKDKMESILYSVANLDDQIKVFNEDKEEYRKAYEEGQLASGSTYNKGYFTNVFTNNGAFSITENGDISFNSGGTTSLYKDHAGKWNSKDNIDESFILESFVNAEDKGYKGVKVSGDRVYQRMHAKFKRSTNNEMQVLATTDLTSDNEELTFQQQFANGTLGKSIYDGFKSIGKDINGNDIYDTEWMFESKNDDKLKTVMAKYFKNVVVDGNTNALEEYNDNIYNINKQTLLKLPWGDVLGAQTEDERDQEAVVKSLLNNNEYVTIGGSGFQRQADGKYKQITAEEGGVEKEIEAEEGKTLPTYSVVQMVQKYGGRFGIVSNDFDVLKLGLKE